MSESPSRSCDVCGGPLSPRRKRFCSDKCKYRWWWARRWADPVKRAAHQARDRDRKRQLQRERVAARPPAEQRTCPECNGTFPVTGNGQRYCSWACNRSARNARRRGAEPTSRPDVLVLATVWRFGVFAPIRMRVAGTVTVGVMAYCPECGTVLLCLTPGSSDSRSCLNCGTEVVMVQESVDAAIRDRRLSR